MSGGENENDVFKYEVETIPAYQAFPSLAFARLLNGVDDKWYIPVVAVIENLFKSSYRNQNIVKDLSRKNLSDYVTRMLSVERKKHSDDTRGVEVKLAFTVEDVLKLLDKTSYRSKYWKIDITKDTLNRYKKLLISKLNLPSSIKEKKKRKKISPPPRKRNHLEIVVEDDNDIREEAIERYMMMPEIEKMAIDRQEARQAKLDARVAQAEAQHMDLLAQQIEKSVELYMQQNEEKIIEELSQRPDIVERAYRIAAINARVKRRRNNPSEEEEEEEDQEQENNFKLPVIQSPQEYLDRYLERNEEEK